MRRSLCLFGRSAHQNFELKFTVASALCGRNQNMTPLIYVLIYVPLGRNHHRSKKAGRGWSYHTHVGTRRSIGLRVLTTEMTASVSMLLPMLSACAVAMLTPTLLREPPIYESLRRALASY